eukprot:scaffold268251_cov37-Tisochrysis_lutea.AAC.6
MNHVVELWTPEPIEDANLKALGVCVPLSSTMVQEGATGYKCVMRLMVVWLRLERAGALR